MKSDFSELHCHTEYSNTHLTDSTNKLEPTIDHAVSIGLRGLAITDHDCLSGHIKALEYMKQVREAHPDFTLILGNEIYLCHGREDYIISENGKKYYNIESGHFYHFILLAKDSLGYRQLRELSTRAWSRMYSYKGMERIPTFFEDVEEIVAPCPGHLVASTACIGGEFAQKTLEGDAQGALDFASWCIRIFGKENFFIELQPGLSVEQRTLNTRAVKFCKYFGFPWIITNDCHYLTKDKRKLHENFLKSHEDDRETGDFYESTYFKTPDEMIARMQDDLSSEDIEAGFANTIRITEMCRHAGDYGLFHTTIVPQREIQEEPVVQGLLSQWYPSCPSIRALQNSPYIQDRFFLSELEKGLQKKNIPITAEVAERINIEAQQLLGISEKLGCRLTSYYNLMQWVEDIIWQVSIIGPGRGSAGSLYCAYLMDITSTNSLEHHLPYWRHTHISKVSMPDIDIDLSPSLRPQIFEMIKEAFGRDKCLNIITFKSETLKSAIKTAARGLDIDSDLAQELSSLVPVTRGRVWSLKECLEGNEDNGFVPVSELVKKINQHDGLMETIAEIEGLISGRGSHASGFYMFNQPFLEQTSLMKTPSGLDVTCWEMEDCDKTGALKFDLLVTDAIDKLQTCLELLCQDGVIERKPTLKETYNAYLHPSVLNYTCNEMWNCAGNSEVTDLFQFMTAMGIEAVRKIKPRSVEELATSSSIMRLMAENGEEQPIDRYVRIREHPEAWDQEMQKAGLTESEMTILKEYMAADYGCSATQEVAMMLSMDSSISGFNMSEADSLRKIIGKKQIKKLPALKEAFFKKGQELGTRKEMLEYTWKWGFLPQLGYSFNQPHTLSYAMIALQEMNLYYYYPHVYWQCACLTVNASANEDGEDNKSTNYGKIASAIGAMQSQGVSIALPEINSAGFGFRPDAKNNRIIFGLKGMTGIGDDLAREVLASRPYENAVAFYDKLLPPVASMITLVKGGCFDALEQKPREVIMDTVLSHIAETKIPAKDSLNFQNFTSVCSLDGFLPERFDFAKRMVFYRNYIFKPSACISNRPKAYLLDSIAKLFFEDNLTKFFSEGSDYYYEDDRLIVYHSKFEKEYKKIIQDLTAWLSSPATASLYTIAIREKYAKELKEKYCEGSIPKWEMDSLSFYYGKHELSDVPLWKYGVENFFALPEEAEILSVETKKNTKTGKDFSWNRYKLSRIAGTVLDANKIRHTISLLTVQGVVNVKFYAGAFVHYSKVISNVDSQGKKSVLEKSWFQRGGKLLIAGYRRGDTFIPKTYYNSVYPHTVCLITSVSPGGELRLKTEREEVKSFV